MAGTKVLVTGGAGRIGSSLVDLLVRSGDEVTVLDMKHGTNEKAKYIVAPLNEIFEIGDFDVVYHLAAKIDYKASQDELLEANLKPTKRLLELCKGVRQFIFMSTSSVYGESDGSITETTNPDPYSNYGQSKLECEKAIQMSGLPYTIIRSSQVYGADFEEGYASVLKHLRQGDMKIFGDGKNYIPLVHIDDLLTALVLVKDKASAIRQVFNVDSSYEKTQEEFMGIAAAILGVPAPEKHINPTLAKLMGTLTSKRSSVTEYIDKLTKNRLISIKKIRSLGFEPEPSLEEGMVEVIETFEERGLL